MAGNLDTIAAYLGFVLFVLFFLGLVIYTLTRSWRRSVQVGLDSVRAKLRLLHTRLGEFRSGFQLFSPGDPEPFGPLVEKALDRLVGVELVLRGLFDRYSSVHGDISRLHSIRDWRLLQTPWLWYKKRTDLVDLAEDILKFESGLDELFSYQGRLNQLNLDVAKKCQSILQTSNQVSSALEKLHQAGLRGQDLERVREIVHNWQTTILNQVPVIFFSTDSASIRAQADKDTTARVYRLNQAAEPAIAHLLDLAEEWKQNSQNYLANSEKLKAGIPDIQRIIDELSQSPDFPVAWEQTKIRMDALSQAAGELETVFANRNVADLSGLASQSDDLFKEMVAISERLADARSDHMELCSLSLSDEMNNGPDVLKSAYKLSDAISPYHAGNFLAGDAVSSLNSDLKATASLQGRLMRFQTTSPVHEGELSRRLDLARNLILQYKSLTPRLESIRKRLKQMEEWERASQKQVNELRQVTTVIEALVQENQHLKKAVGNELAKITSQVAGLSEDLSLKEKDTVERKAEQCQALYARVIKELEKWSEVVSNQISIAHTELSEQIGVLRDLVWIDDPIMVESENLLSAAPSQNSYGESISGQQDQMLNRLENLVKVDEILRQHTNALQRINQVAGPVLANYRQAERSHDAVAGMMRKIAEIAPQDEESWPPTTIRLGAEQARVAQLEREWSSLRKERLKASALAGKLTSLLAEYKTIEASLEEGIGRIRQEQTRFKDYERRLEDSRRMWRRVSANFADNRVVSDGVSQLLTGVDQEIERLRTRYSKGELNYSLALQAMKQICRKLDEGVVEVDRSQIVDINGEIQRLL